MGVSGRLGYNVYIYPKMATKFKSKWIPTKPGTLPKVYCKECGSLMYFTWGDIENKRPKCHTCLNKWTTPK